MGDVPAELIKESFDILEFRSPLLRLELEELLEVFRRDVQAVGVNILDPRDKSGRRSWSRFSGDD